MKNNAFYDDEKTLENETFSCEAASYAASHDGKDDTETENIEISEEFEDPTAPGKTDEFNDFSETEKSAENNTFSPKNASTADSRGVHNPEIVKMILEMEEKGLSGRRIHDELGNEDVTKEDVFAVLKHFRAWTQERVDSGFTSDTEPEEAEKTLEFQAKIEELKKENTRIWTEKNDLARELKTIVQDRDGLRKWQDQFQPELQASLDKAEEEAQRLTNENVDLKNRLEGQPSKLWQAGVNFVDVYAQGRKAGLEEAAGKREKEGLHWSYYFLVAGAGIAGIFTGSILTKLFS